MTTRGTPWHHARVFRRIGRVLFCLLAGLSIVAFPALADAEEAFDPYGLPLEDRADLADAVGRNLPEATLTPAGSLRIRGADPGDNAAFLDGYRLDRLARVPLAAVDRVHVATAALDPGFADVPGGTLRLSSRIPEDRFAWHLHAEQTLDRHRFSRAVDGFVAAPLWGPRLAAVFGVHAEEASMPDVIELEGILPAVPDPRATTLAGLLKVVATFSPHQRLDLMALLDGRNGENGLDLGASPTSMPMFRDRGVLLGARWRGQFGKQLSATTQVAFQRSGWREFPRLCDQDLLACRQTPTVVQTYPRRFLLENGLHLDHRIERSGDVAAGLAWDEQWFSGSGHRVLLTARVRARSSDEWQGIPANRVITKNGDLPFAETVGYANDPRFEPPVPGQAAFPGRSLHTVFALEDEVRLWNRLWVKPGLALVSSRASNDWVRIDQTAVAPSLRAAWNITPSGGTRLEVASGIRYSDVLEAYARLAAGSPFTQECRWNPQTNAFDRCTLRGGPNGAALLRLCEKPRLDGSCSGFSPLPRTTEHRLALSQVWGFAHFEAKVVSRNTRDLPPLVRRNVYRFTGPQHLGLPADSPQPLVVAASNEPAHFRRYLGATLSATVRAGGLHGDLAYHRANIRDANGADSAADRRHVVRASVRYQVPGIFSLAVLFRADSGLPYAHRFYNDETGLWERKTPVGLSPGRDLNDPADDHELRLPWTHQINLQLQSSLSWLVPIDLAVSLDFINLLDDQEITGRGEQDARDYMLPTSFQELRWVRLGLTHRH